MDEDLQLEHQMAKATKGAVVSALENVEEVKVELDSMFESPLNGGKVDAARSLAEQLESRLEELLADADAELTRVEARHAAEEKFAAERSAPTNEQRTVPHVG